MTKNKHGSVPKKNFFLIPFLVTLLIIELSRDHEVMKNNTKGKS